MSRLDQCSDDAPAHPTPQPPKPAFPRLFVILRSTSNVSRRVCVIVVGIAERDVLGNYSWILEHCPARDTPPLSELSGDSVQPIRAAEEHIGIAPAQIGQVPPVISLGTVRTVLSDPEDKALRLSGGHWGRNCGSRTTASEVF